MPLSPEKQVDPSPSSSKHENDLGTGILFRQCFSLQLIISSYLCASTLGVRYPDGQPEQNSTQQMRKIYRDLPGTVKIVSSSFLGHTPSNYYGADLPLASIEAAGNDDRDTFLDPAFITEFGDDEGLRALRAAIAADKMLLVAGYNNISAEDGVYERSGVSRGCIGEGYSEGCIWVPDGYRYPRYAEDRIVDMGGTSASAPHLASALASVLAVFPDTSPVELIRLVKACAIPTPSLPGGVGRADFTCLTTRGDNGQWELISDEAFAELVK